MPPGSAKIEIPPKRLNQIDQVEREYSYMGTFEISVYGADPRKGAKPCRTIEVRATNGSEATKLVMDQLAGENCGWWVELDARPVEP